jgi:hypothetical protein
MCEMHEYFLFVAKLIVFNFTVVEFSLNVQEMLRLMIHTIHHFG